MKPTHLLPVFWWCTFFLCVTYALGNNPDRGVVGSPDLSAMFDTVDVNTVPPEIKNALRYPAILPQPGAKLNFTQIMFEHPQVSGADEYMIEVALDDGSNTFAHLLSKQRDSSTATMLGNFEFGKKYIWRYTGLRGGKETGWQGPYKFETMTSPAVDKNLFRARILKNDVSANAGGLIILDVAGSIIDRNGKFVWFYPVTEMPGGMSNPLDKRTTDLQLTPFGTITAIYDRKAQERDLSGNLLWQAPPRKAADGDSMKYVSPYAYHHCFKRLANGNYMVIDQDNLSIPDTVLNGRSDEVPYNIVAKAVGGNTIVADEIIKEFEPTGKLVWSWSSEKYFDNIELRKMVASKPDAGMLHPEPGGHMNAFDVDEKNGFVYAGFRNISRVIKINKASGKVVCSWSDDSTGNTASANGAGFFLKQHGATLLHDGQLAVFNNNFKMEAAANENPVSSVVIFTQPTAGNKSRITWKFDCRFDSVNNMGSLNGNVDELKNGNLLVCMGSVNRVFEITRDKRIVWSALIEKRFPDYDTSWQKFGLYRAHYTSSLYPCYFTVQNTARVSGNGQLSFELRIFNDGTEADSYQLNIVSATKNYAEQFSSSVLKAKKSQTFNITPPVGTDAITVTVKSTTNPEFTRVINVK